MLLFVVYDTNINCIYAIVQFFQTTTLHTFPSNLIPPQKTSGVFPDNQSSTNKKLPFFLEACPVGSQAYLPPDVANYAALLQRMGDDVEIGGEV